MTTAVDTEMMWRDISTRLRAFVARRVGNPFDVDDIVQTVFLRIHTGLPDVRDRDRLMGWIFQVTRNAITDYYRAAPRRREVASDELPELPLTTADGAIDEFDDAAEVRRELAACLEPFIDALTPQYKEALRLTELGELTQAEAAQQVGVSVSGMKSRVQRARRQVLDLLHDCCTFSLDGRGAPIAYAPRCERCD